MEENKKIYVAEDKKNSQLHSLIEENDPIPWPVDNG